MSITSKTLKKMKTKLFKLATAVVLTIISISCSTEENNTPPAPLAGDAGFVWTINGTATPKNTTVANYNIMDTEMNLFATPSGTVFEINLTGSTPGTYTLGSGNALYYNFSTAENLTNPTAGSVIITSVADNKVSGTFTASGTGTGVTSISGTFSNIGL
jgi:hypothetical protein